jgi:hypothetical protein
LKFGDEPGVRVISKHRKEAKLVEGLPAVVEVKIGTDGK